MDLFLNLGGDVLALGRLLMLFRNSLMLKRAYKLVRKDWISRISKAWLPEPL
jgi:hypothetical protein